MSVSRHIGCKGNSLRQLPRSHHRAPALQIMRRRRLHVQARLPCGMHLRRFQPGEQALFSDEIAHCLLMNLNIAHSKFHT